MACTGSWDFWMALVQKIALHCCTWTHGCSYVYLIRGILPQKMNWMKDYITQATNNSRSYITWRSGDIRVPACFMIAVLKDLNVQCSWKCNWFWGNLQSNMNIKSMSLIKESKLLLFPCLASAVDNTPCITHSKMPRINTQIHFLYSMPHFWYWFYGLYYHHIV